MFLRRWVLAEMVLLMGCRSEAPAPPPPASGAVAIAVPSTSSREAPASPAPAASPTPQPAEGHVQGACRSDADCMLSTFAGCCSCCPCTLPRPIPIIEDTAQRSACASKSCWARCDTFVGDCVACKDPAKEGMHARCIESQCALVETKGSR